MRFVTTNYVEEIPGTDSLDKVACTAYNAAKFDCQMAVDKSMLWPELRTIEKFGNCQHTKVG
jgi:hypothetical protein